MAVIKYILLGVSIIGLLGSFKLFYDAGRPCSGDGCMIHFLYFIAIPLFIISAIATALLYKRTFGKKNKYR
jgi:hypothetical protein